MDAPMPPFFSVTILYFSALSAVLKKTWDGFPIGMKAFLREGPHTIFMLVYFWGVWGAVIALCKKKGLWQM